MTESPDINIEDFPALVGYLETRGLIAQGVQPVVRSLPGGISAKTVFVGDDQGVGIVVKQSLPKLRVRDDWYCSPARMHREALGLQLLQGVEPGVVPGLLFEDRANHILAMRAVPEPHANFRSMLLAGEIHFDYFEQFGQMLAAVQTTPIPFGDEFAELRDISFFAALRLEPYYATAAKRLPEVAGFLNKLVEKTRETHDMLVHGDFSPKNVLIHQGRLQLLDFEVIHLGDGGFDIGFAMTHFLAKAVHLPARRENMLEGARVFLRAYRGANEQLSLQTRASGVAHTIGCLLGRVAGRSPLNYLMNDQRATLQKIAVEMTRCAIGDPLELVDVFARLLTLLERS